MEGNAKRISATRRVIGTILLVPAVLIGVLLAWNAPKTFTMTGTIQMQASRLLGAEVDNRYAGGPVVAKFRDRAGDDSGAGALSYPLHDSFQEGHVMDLLSYAVHVPVVANLPFVPDRAFWQLDFAMAELGPAVIHAYIDLDGTAGGSFESPDNGNEGIAFDPDHPWDLFIEVNVNDVCATMRESDDEKPTTLSVYRNVERKTLMVRIPLDRPGTKRVLDGRTTWHYVMVGAWDDYARGHFMPVAAVANLRTAGGSESRMTPRIFDYLNYAEKSQGESLSSFDEESGRLAILTPVESRAGLAANKGLGEKAVAELEAKVEAETAIANARQIEASTEAMLAAGQNPEPSMELARHYMVLGKLDEADAVYDTLLAKDPGDLVARAAKGTAVSARCLTAKSLDETIAFVNQAFVFLDAAYLAAEKLGATSPSALPWEAFAQLCYNVPEVPFGRSRSGAAAFERAAKWHEAAAAADPERAAAHTADMARDYLMAGLCFEKAQGKEEAEICFLKAGSMAEMDGQTRLELAKRGY